MFALIANAAGLELSLAQAGLIMGGLALSTSIPAAPGSIGTYEFVGPDDHDDARRRIPRSRSRSSSSSTSRRPCRSPWPGLLAAWHFHFRVSEIAQDAEPGRLAQDDGPTAPA